MAKSRKADEDGKGSLVRYPSAVPIGLAEPRRAGPGQAGRGLGELAANWRRQLAYSPAVRGGGRGG